MIKMFLTLMFLFFTSYANISVAVLEPLSGNVDEQTKSILYDKIFTELKSRKIFNIITREEINNKTQLSNSYRNIYYDNKYTAKIAKVIDAKYAVCGNITKKDNIYIFDIKIMKSDSGNIIDNIHLDCVGCDDDITRMESMRFISNKIVNHITDYDAAHQPVEHKEIIVPQKEEPKKHTAVKVIVTITSLLLLASGVYALFL